MKRLALILMMVLVPGAAVAQEPVFKGLEPAAMPTVFVLDDRGVETRGKLVRLDEHAVVILVDGQQRRFETARVDRVAKRGDSLKNGAIAGAVVGAVIGAITGGLADCRNDQGGYGSCGAGGRAALAVVSTALYAAVGTGIDAAVQGRTVMYQAPALGIAADAKGASVRLTLRW